LEVGIRSFIYTRTATVYGRAVLHPVTETHPSFIIFHDGFDTGERKKSTLPPFAIYSKKEKGDLKVIF